MRSPAGGGFVHEAWLYQGLAQFVTGAAAFVREGMKRGDAVLVLVTRPKVNALRAVFGEAQHDVRFIDVAEVGPNPAAVTSAWCDFVSASTTAGRAARGIGEPIWPERTPDEITECHRHEAALNLAFAHGPAWRLLCPYDTGALQASVVHDACRTHPFLTNGSASRASGAYQPDVVARLPLEAPLPPADAPAHELLLTAANLRDARALVAEIAAPLLTADRLADLTLATSELVTNSVMHGGGQGLLLVWHDEQGVVCEVRDAGVVTDSLAGRRRPPAHRRGGRGLWIANQVCDLVQLRSGEGGTIVRVRMYRDVTTGAVPPAAHAGGITTPAAVGATPASA